MKKLLAVILCLAGLMMAAAAQAQMLAPMEPGALSMTNGEYCVKITEAAHINAGGYFAMEMYAQDQYPRGGLLVQVMHASYPFGPEE